MKKILIMLSFIFVLILISIIGYSIVSANVTVDEVGDAIALQTNKEKYLTPYGYTLDNPNVILNPYGNSPLTAIILFETDDDLPVTITVQGKDQNSTYINTFESTKRHYIPVYGLYANETNYIKLECGSKTKTIELKTESLPEELLSIPNITNNTNNLTFITSNRYPYALDNNNDIRWYLTKHCYGKINYLENGNLLLSDETSNLNYNSYGLIEIDLLGKIHKQYTLDTPYLGSYEETNNTIIINTNPSIEVEKQTGTILKTNNTKAKSLEILHENQTLLPLYTTNKNYFLTKSIKYSLTKETPKSTKSIFLVGYIDPDDNYTNYNIKITKNKDNLTITGNFDIDDEVYLILDRFLDKRVYDINENQTIINKQGLSGKYSIYISINNTIYKTNNYIKF